MADKKQPLPIGAQVGHLKVTGDRELAPWYTQRVWCQRCECVCGNTRLIPVSSLVTERIKSCGCRRGPRSHGATAKGSEHWPIYLAWRNMEQRCNNANHTFYNAYGGRGIKVDPKWHKNFPAFLAWALAEGWSKGKILGRKENDDDYTPLNTTWSEPKNAFGAIDADSSTPVLHIGKAGSVNVTSWGETKSLYEWARDARCRVTAPAIAYRLRKGWASEDAVGLVPHGYSKLAGTKG